MSIANLCGSLQRQEDDLRCWPVGSKSPDRPVFHSQLGKMLVSLREQRKWSVQEAVNYSGAKHPKALTWNRLTRLERGKTKHPDAEALRALADLYDLDYFQLASGYVAANYGRDLLEQAGTGHSGSPQEGESDGPAQTRIQPRRKVSEDAIAEEIHAVTSRLFDLSTALVEARKARRKKASGHGELHEPADRDDVRCPNSLDSTSGRAPSVTGAITVPRTRALTRSVRFPTDRRNALCLRCPDDR